MKLGLKLLAGGLAFVTAHAVLAQSGELDLPKVLVAGSALSIPSAVTGKSVVYIVGPAQAIRREVAPGQGAFIPGGELDNAGHYVVFVAAEGSSASGAFDVVPADKPASLSFLARPSRLYVGLHDGVSGAVYVFDPYQNLILAPTPVSFQLSAGGGPAQSRTVVTRDGHAWTQVDSTAKEGAAQFVARVGDISSTRVIQQVPGNPCGLKMSARKAGQQLQLETEPVRDCAGNAVPDGTVVTFTESYNGTLTTVDSPLKHGVATAQVPAYMGAKISAATGVVMGNEIRWEGQ